MKHARIYLVLPVIGLALIGFGCGKKVVINTPNGNVNGTIDVTRNSANMNINGTTLQTGQQVSLPADFPSDVYVIAGTIKTAVSTPNVSDTVALTATASMADANALYKQKLQDSGWTITTSGVIDVHSAAILASKDTRTVSVAISDTDGPTVVTITVMRNVNNNANTSPVNSGY